MSNTTKRKSAFQAFCRKQVKAGMINQPDGTWAQAQTNKAMDQSMVAGYRFSGIKRTSKSKSKVKAEVE